MDFGPVSQHRGYKRCLRSQLQLVRYTERTDAPGRCAVHILSILAYYILSRSASCTSCEMGRVSELGKCASEELNISRYQRREVLAERNSVHLQEASTFQLFSERRCCSTSMLVVPPAVQKFESNNLMHSFCWPNFRTLSREAAHQDDSEAGRYLLLLTWNGVLSDWPSDNCCSVHVAFNKQWS